MLAMRCVGFGLFPNIGVKKVFFNSWWFFFEISPKFDVRYTSIFLQLSWDFSEPVTGTYDYNVIHDFIDSIYRVRLVKIIRFLTNGLT